MSFIHCDFPRFFPGHTIPVLVVFYFYFIFFSLRILCDIFLSLEYGKIAEAISYLVELL